MKLGYTLFWVDDATKTVDFYEKALGLKKGFHVKTNTVKWSGVKAAFNTAVSAGATSVSKPKTKPWGQVVSYVQDCNGVLVEICSPIG